MFCTSQQTSCLHIDAGRKTQQANINLNKPEMERFYSTITYNDISTISSHSGFGLTKNCWMPKKEEKKMLRIRSIRQL